MKIVVLNSLSKTIRNIPLLNVTKDLKKIDLGLDKFVINKVQPLVSFLKTDISFGLGLKCWHVLAVVGCTLVIKIIFDDNKDLTKKLNKFMDENPKLSKFLAIGVVVGSGLIIFL